MCSSPTWPWLFLLLPLILLILSDLCAGAQPFAQGNLALVFEPRTGRSSESSAQMVNLSALWCQATANGQDRLPIKSARFVHLQPPPVRFLPASRLSPGGDRAFLDFGLVPISAIGKYRCEITTARNEMIAGNLFVYMRPVLAVNASMRLDQAEEGNAFAWVGPSNKVPGGEDAVLHCPAVGYPAPRVHWSKDGEPINLSRLLDEDIDGDTNGNPDEDDQRKPRKYWLDGNRLHIRRVCPKDEGIYKCVARNEFPPKVDNPKEAFELSLEQHLRVTSSLSWLPPLLVIVACLLLLVLIIYGCAAWKRYKYRQYNVAQKERELVRNGGKDVEAQQRLPPSEEID